MFMYKKITDLLPLQAELDKKILESRGLTREETFLKRIIALKCEFYEFLNEWRGFKYWSKNPSTTMTGATEHFQASKEEKLLLEACDVLHFLLSLYYDCKIDCEIECDLNDVLLVVKDNRKRWALVGLTEIDLIESFDSEVNDFSDFKTLGELGGAIHTFLRLCERFGITETMLIRSYLQKNEVNHERQDNGY